METRISALLALQSIERKLAHLRSRLRARKNAVRAQQRQIEQLRIDHEALHEKSMNRRKDADRLELDLKHREQQVARQRAALNAAKTNKEYATLLTQINTLRADNSKLEEQILRLMQELDTVKAESDEIRQQIEQEEARLAEIEEVTGEQVRKLEGMIEDFSAQRVEAAKAIPSDTLSVFDRLVGTYDGEAMAVIEAQGASGKAHDTYVCGGCFMSLTPEHVNALRSRDEIRTCDNCGRILYLEPQAERSQTK